MTAQGLERTTTDGGTGLRSPWQPLAAVGAMVAAGAHLPVTPEHLRGAPYVGALFVAFSLVVLGLGALLLLRDTALRYALLGGACLAAVLAYACTRLVAFPEIADDVGHWWEPWGVVSVLSEALTVAVCARACRAAGRA